MSTPLRWHRIGLIETLTALFRARKLWPNAGPRHSTRSLRWKSRLLARKAFSESVGPAYSGSEMLRLTRSCFPVGAPSDDSRYFKGDVARPKYVTSQDNPISHWDVNISFKNPLCCKLAMLRAFSIPFWKNDSCRLYASPVRFARSRLAVKDFNISDFENHVRYRHLYLEN